MATKKYYDSAFGTAVHPHLNQADTKFNADGLFKTGLRLEGEAAQKEKARIDAASEAAYEEHCAEMTPAERKKWSTYFPYTVEEDDEGNPTGAIVFHFKQNATIRLRDGTVKKINIGLYDATGKEMSKPIWGGSEIRVNYSMRTIVMKSAKEVGVRLDFGRVQVKRLVSTGSGGGGFGAVEDGYEDDGEDYSPSPSSGGEGGDTTSPSDDY